MLKVGIVGIGGRMGHALWDCCLGLDGAKIIILRCLAIAAT